MGCTVELCLKVQECLGYEQAPRHPKTRRRGHGREGKERGNGTGYRGSSGKGAMSEVLSFPGLGLELNIQRVAFYLPGFLGGRPVYWYGIIIAAAFLLAAIYAIRRVKAFGLDPDRMIDVVLCGVVLGVIGARLYYVVFSWENYRGDPVSVFKIWEGGLAIYGGIIGALIAGVIACRIRRVKLLPMLDLAATSMLLGQAIGRWGNFTNIEAFGSNTTMPWGMTSWSIQNYLSQNQASLAAIGVTVDPAVPVHPTFFYESVWCLLGFLFLAWFTSRRRFDGQLALIYIGWYSLGRFFIEGLRTDSLLIGSLRVSQLLAACSALAALVALVVVSSKIRRANDPGYLPLYVTTEEGKAVLAGTFYQKPATGKEAPQPAPETAGQNEAAEPEAETAHGEEEVSPEKTDEVGE